MNDIELFATARAFERIQHAWDRGRWPFLVAVLASIADCTSSAIRAHPMVLAVVGATLCIVVSSAQGPEKLIVRMLAIAVPTVALFAALGRGFALYADAFGAVEMERGNSGMK